MLILYFVFLPLFLIVVATFTVTQGRSRLPMRPLEHATDPREVANALRHYKYVQLGMVIVTGLLGLFAAMSISDAAHGDTSTLKVLPIVAVMVVGGSWIAFLGARLRCANAGITTPRIYVRGRANEQPYRD